MKNKGQVSIGLILSLVVTTGGVVAAAFGMSNDVRNDLSAEVSEVRTKAAQASERTAVLETSVPAMKEDIKDIKESLDRMEAYFRIPQPRQ